MENTKATIDELRKILAYITKGYKVPKVIHDVIFKIAKYEVEEKRKVVLIKRDPNIHKGRIQAVYVNVIEGEAMSLHPATVGGYGADFDGDTMAVFVPITKEAQEEAKKKMVSAVASDSINSPNFKLSNEMLTGLFTLTHSDLGNSPKLIRTIEELDKMHPGTRVKMQFRGAERTTTVGRIIFNSKLPVGHVFIDEPVNKKVINGIMSKIIEKSRGEYAATIDAVMRLGFEAATKYPRSLSIDMFHIPANLMKLKEKLNQEKDTMKQQEIITQMEKELVEHLKVKVPELYDMLVSGAAKGAGQLRQVMVAKGLFSDAEGNILPVVARSMNEGYRPDDYFNAAGGSRKGIINRVHTTAAGGYAYRKMVYVMGNIEANPENRDCETRLFFKVKLTPELYKRMGGRYVQEKFGGPIIPVTKDMIGKVISLRSPVFCRSLKVCATCYGQLLEQINSTAIGIIAAQECASLSEKIMKCSDGLIHKDGKLIAFADFFESVQSEVESDGFVEMKRIETQIEGREGQVFTSQIEKHMPTDEMVFISTKSGHTLICQRNHPVWVKLNSLHSKYPNRTCRLIGDELYSTIGTGRSQEFQTEDNELMCVPAGDLQKYDSIWIDNRICVNDESIIPDINPYFLGAYIGDGNLLKYNEKYTPGFGISQIDGPVKNRILEECSGFEHFVYDGNIVFKDPEERLLAYVRGRYSYEKHLPEDFISYDKNWLRSFLAGLIDTDGTVFGSHPTGTCCRISTSSYYLVQQLKAICLKLGYRMNTTIVSGNNAECSGYPQKRVHFSCDIRFHSSSIVPNSVKIQQNGGVTPIQKHYADEFPVRGFDPITTIKTIWKWDYPVYDIKTSTEDFLLGCVQNHNSFHTGGAVDIKRMDIMKNIMENIDDGLESLIKSNFHQDENSLISDNDSVMIEIIKDIYQDENKIVETPEFLKLPVGNFDMRLENLLIPMTVEQETKFYLKDVHREEDDKHIILSYTKGQPIFLIEPSVLAPEEVARRLDKYVGGKSPWTTPESLYAKFYKILSPFGDWDSVHLETILANILRWKEDPHMPARVKYPYNPATFSIKDLPGVMSYPLGIAFENFSKSITYGMISERGAESSIEKVFFGEPLTGDKYKPKK